MIRTILFLLIAFSFTVPVVAQDAQEEDEEPRYVCPAFTDASTVERTSYYMGEGAAYMRSRNYAAAINSYGCIVQQIDPNSRDAYLNRAAAYSARREYEEALDDYDAALRIDGSFAPSYSNRGVIYTAIQEYEQAMSDFERAIDLESGYAAAYINRGILSAILEDYDAALADFQQAIDLAGLDTVLAELRDPERPDDAPAPVYDAEIAQAYALIGVVYSQQALANYEDYLLLTGSRADSRIQSAAGALQSRFSFDLRLDEGGWMLVADFIGQ